MSRHSALATVCFATPLRICKSGASYIVEDAHGVALAFVYFENEPLRRGLINRLSGADAKAASQTIARALTDAAGAAAS